MAEPVRTGLKQLNPDSLEVDFLESPGHAFLEWSAREP